MVPRARVKETIPWISSELESGYWRHQSSLVLPWHCEASPEPHSTMN